MRIDRVTVVSAGAFPHPTVAYCTLRPEVHLSATLSDGEDVCDAVARLRASADILLEQHLEALARMVER